MSPYYAEWQQLFEEEKARLQLAIGKHVLDIQHVGSTSIPNMPAKPIIDIGIAVDDYDAASVCVEPIQQMGYLYKGENGVPRRHYFRKGEPCTNHLHINEIDSEGWENQILFRDYLIQHPEKAADYALLKTTLAKKYPQDRKSYLDGKELFIQDVLHFAREQS